MRRLTKSCGQAGAHGSPRVFVLSSFVCRRRNAAKAYEARSRPVKGSPCPDGVFFPSDDAAPPRAAQAAGCGPVDLSASYNYNEDVSGDFTISNVFNHRHTQFLSSGPNPGTVIKLGLNVKFAAR